MPAFPAPGWWHHGVSDEEEAVSIADDEQADDKSADDKAADDATADEQALAERTATIFARLIGARIAGSLFPVPFVGLVVGRAIAGEVGPKLGRAVATGAQAFVKNLTAEPE